MKIKQEHFDAMMNKTKCRFWNGLSKNSYTGKLIAISLNTYYPFFSDVPGVGEVNYENCEPIGSNLLIENINLK